VIEATISFTGPISFFMFFPAVYPEGLSVNLVRSFCISGLPSLLLALDSTNI
jgi:hypothetical protein